MLDTLWLLLLLCLLQLLHSSPYVADVEQRQKKASKTSDSYVVLTRIFYDYAYLTHFVTWHLSLGFDFIYIICTEDEFEREPDFRLDPHLRPYVEIFYDETDLNPDLIMDRYVELIRSRNHTWVLSIDLDEFLLLSQEYQDVQSFVKRMESHFHGIHIDLFQLHWALLEYTSPRCPNMTLAELVNHTVVHHSQLTKSLIRLTHVQNIRASHYPTFMKHYTPNIYAGHSIIHGVNMKHTLNRDSYKYASILHVRTRGLTDNIMKAISTRFEEKKSHSKSRQLINFIETSTEEICRGNINHNLLDNYIKNVGLRSSNPLSHLQESVIDVSNALFPTATQHVMFCNQSVEYQSMLKSFSYHFYANVTDEKERNEKTLNLTYKFQQILAPALTASYQLRLKGQR